MIFTYSTTVPNKPSIHSNAYRSVLTSMHKSTRSTVPPYMNADVFVYCGVKCGSTTLNTTFRKNGYSTVHCHYNEHFQKEIARTNAITSFDAIRSSVQLRPSRPVYIIDAYRDPIERLISTMFERIDQKIPAYRTMTIPQLIAWFNTNLLFTTQRHPIDEVMRHFDVPTFTTFDFTKRYNMARKGRLVFIKVRFADIEDWGDILSDAFGRPIRMFSNNLTEQKDVYALYKEFKRQYRVPRTYLDDVLPQNKMFYIYNTEEEQAAYIRRWTK